MKFVWDENKNLKNIKKHKVSFVQAVYAFSDPEKKEFYDERHSSRENRYLLFGFAINSVLVISFSEPDAETIRIISARKAKKHELEAINYGNG